MKTLSICLLVGTVVLQVNNTQGANNNLIVPRNCANKAMCFENPSSYENYPQKAIDAYLKHSPLPNSPDFEEDEMDKLNHEREDEINCSTEVQMLRPFSVKGENNRWYPVVQSKFFTQRIRHVTCKNQGGQCMRNIFLQEDRFQATCETQVGEIDVYVFDEVSEKVKLLPVPVSTCCKCTIRDKTKD